MMPSTPTHVKIIGYCEYSPQEITTKAQKRIDRSFLEFFGVYLLVIERGKDVYICSSVYGFSQYFYTIVNGQLIHGETVLDVFQQSGLPWEYNYRALADITGLEHTLEDDTLHPKIKRVPPRTLIRFVDGGLKIEQFEWEDFHTPSVYNDQTPAEALCYFNRHIERTMGQDNVILMSGGLDSRLILSALLKAGVHPKLMTVGFEDSGDRIVAGQIAKAYDLDFEPIQLGLADYLDYGKVIARQTGGMLPADHWHFQLATHKSQLIPNATYYHGANGEYARCYYADYGWLARIGNLIPSLTLPFYWRVYLRLVVAKNTRTIRQDELDDLNPDFAEQLDASGYTKRIQRLYELGQGNFFAGTDERFYLEQRVRLFQSNHLMDADGIRWSLPFLDRDWINTVSSMPLRWKFGSNWHRYAIQQNEPRLLEFISAKTAKPVHKQEHWWYWLPELASKRPGVKPKMRGYEAYRTWFAQPEFEEFIEDHKSLISDLIEPRFVIDALHEHQTYRNRKKLFGFLLSQIYWRELINETRPQRKVKTFSDEPMPLNA